MTTPFFNDLLQAIAERGRGLLDRDRAGRDDNADGAADLVGMAHDLLNRAGEATGMAVAARLLAGFAAADRVKRLAFYRALLDDFGPARDRLAAALAAYQATGDHEAAVALHAAAEPRRQELIRRLNLAPRGTEKLVAIREDLLDRLREHPEFAPIDADFRHLLASWFNRGFLVMRRIDWNTPAAILEKIIRYEAVHEIADWGDLRRRIDPPDRRCYAFFHPALLDEPLIFVEVALTTKIPAAIAPILVAERSIVAPAKADTAVFYSISNCQAGLRGISFGSFLIKQVVQDLQRDLPGLTRFVTLSPVPGFRRWLASAPAAAVVAALGPAAQAAIRALDRPGWAERAPQRRALEKVLPVLAAYYFLKAKNARGAPVDPVARFHLGNGARLERINWLGDLSDKAMAQGGGLMVNYLYDLKHIEANHEAFAAQGDIAAAPAVRKLIKNAAALPVSGDPS